MARVREAIENKRGMRSNHCFDNFVSVINCTSVTDKSVFKQFLKMSVNYEHYCRFAVCILKLKIVKVWTFLLVFKYVYEWIKCINTCFSFVGFLYWEYPCHRWNFCFTSYYASNYPAFGHKSNYNSKFYHGFQFICSASFCKPPSTWSNSCVSSFIQYFLCIVHYCYFKTI